MFRLFIKQIQFGRGVGFMQEQEIWKDVVGYEGLYQVSNLGRVKSCARYINRHSKYVIHKKYVKEKILSCCYVAGYPCVPLSKERKRHLARVHRLVAIAFIANPENKEQVNHKDGNRANSNVNNLEWVTNTENQRHSWKYLNRQNPHKGKKFSEETKNKMRLHWKTNLSVRAKKVYCVELNKYFNSINDACRELKIARHIHQCCEGKRHTCGGYHWKWAEENDK